MATCKEVIEGCKKCIHYGVCSSFSPEWFMYNHKENCKDFKHKSHYAEIPCKLGDTVCIRWSWEPVGIRNRITKGTIIGIYIGQNKKPTLTIKHNDHDFRYYRGKFIVEEVLDGERVYLERKCDK